MDDTGVTLYMGGNIGEYRCDWCHMAIKPNTPIVLDLSDGGCMYFHEECFGPPPPSERAE